MERDGHLRTVPLAIVGMACRLPGADDLDQYWQMLIEGRSAVADLPADRFDAELYYDGKKGVRGKSYTRCGAVPTRRAFGGQRCPIDPELVRGADPTHLTMCEVAAEALRHAGIDPLRVPLRNTGVYVGHTIGSGRDADEACAAGIAEAAECLGEVESFRGLPAGNQKAVVEALVGAVGSQASPADGAPPELASHMAAGIISKGFGLSGPFMAVNAACASSLEALALAARALQRGKIDMAIVGGASVCSTEWLVLFSAAQSLSVSQSRPFDRQADGLVVAEGYVAVVLKTLERALADGDRIEAVIRGVGVSSDGRGRSLWAPRREGQVEAIRRAYPSAEAMGELEYIEAHSTATQLGDATEIASLEKAFADGVPAGKKIPITSVKANIGHALEAAGLASLVKVVLCMQKGVIPPAANLEELNPTADWSKAPVYVPRETVAWPEPAAGKARTAGVNAFGIGGLNVHVWLADRNVGGATGAVRAAGGDDEAIAIIGRGCVFAGAHGVGELWDLMRSGRDPKRHVGRERCGLASVAGGCVEGFCYDWRRHRIPPKQIELADPLQFMVLDAADQALREAGYDEKTFDRTRTGVMVGSEFVGDFTFRMKLVLRLPELGRMLREQLVAQGVAPERAAKIERAWQEAVHARWPVLSDESGSFSASSSAVRVAKTWDLMGGAAAVDSGGASGMAALDAAVDMLLAGDCDLVVCAAAQRNLNAGAYQTLAKKGALSNDPSRGPYDRGAEGYVPGEGASAVLLKRLSDARRDGDPIHGVIRGIGVAHDDATHAMSEAVRRSLEESGLEAADLDAAVTDACGLPAVDEQQVRALMAMQGDASRAVPLRLGSLVGQIGHTGGASAGASLLAATLAMDEATLPGVFGLEDPLTVIRRNGARVRCSGDATLLRGTSSGERLAAVVLSSDKGLAYSAVLERGAPVAAGSGGAAGQERIARRWVLRATETPAAGAAAEAFVPNGATVVLGENRAARALVRRLEVQGVVVYRLMPSRGSDAVLAELEALPSEPAVRALFIMTGMDEGGSRLGDAGSWEVRRREGVELPYLVVQKWGQRLQQEEVTGPLTVAAGTLLGGDLGMSERVFAPEGGWIAGLLKAIDIEWNRYERPTQVKVCDFAPSDDADTVAEAMLRELASGQPEVEVGLGGGRRRTIAAVAEAIDRRNGSAPPRGSTWVLTGGARGITAEVAVALGQAYGLDLHLIGRTAAPRADAPWRGCSEEELKQVKRSIVRQAIAEGKSPEKQWERVKHDIEIHNNLERMRGLGLRVTYHSCDVGDWSALESVLGEVRKSGPIVGIVHGAGYARTGRVESQRRDELRASIGAKVDGALGLMLLAREDPLRWFVGFGSISGRYGGNGLSDYAAGNEMLAKLCAWYRIVRPECASTCMEWQSWDAVGMAMLPDSNVGAREVLRMNFIPPEEGVEHLKEELCAGLRQSEVLIEDGEFERLLRPSSHREEGRALNRNEERKVPLKAR